MLFLNFFYNSAQCETERGGASSQEAKNSRIRGRGLLVGLRSHLMTQPFQNKTRMQEPPIGWRLLDFLDSWILMHPVSLTRRIFLLGRPVGTVNDRCS